MRRIPDDFRMMIPRHSETFLDKKWYLYRSTRHTLVKRLALQRPAYNACKYKLGVPFDSAPLHARSQDELASTD